MEWRMAVRSGRFMTTGDVIASSTTISETHMVHVSASGNQTQTKKARREHGGKTEEREAEETKHKR